MDMRSDTTQEEDDFDEEEEPQEFISIDDADIKPKKAF
jgi:hypothetical protein